MGNNTKIYEVLTCLFKKFYFRQRVKAGRPAKIFAKQKLRRAKLNRKEFIYEYYRIS